MKNRDHEIRFTYREDLKEIASSLGYDSIVGAVFDLYNKKGSSETGIIFERSKDWVNTVLRRLNLPRRPKGGHKDRSRMEDLSGSVFGNITVLHEVPHPPDKKSGGKWFRVSCKCGSIHDVCAYSITRVGGITGCCKCRPVGKLGSVKKKIDIVF